MSNSNDLSLLGWQPFFQQQLSMEEWQNGFPARVFEQHKSEITLEGNFERFNLSLSHHMPQMVVGDWVLLDENLQLIRLLERKTCFSRRGAGNESRQQLISANVDTAFIVCSMNEDFNLNRIERYLALAHEAEAEPVVVLSKSDLVSDTSPYIMQVQSLGKWLSIEAVNALDSATIGKLKPWLKLGRTVVVLGSSGVGKSTLANTLLGQPLQATGAIREDDDKGRHTTTRRSLVVLPGGGLLLDTPGMRELQLADCDAGLAATFSEIENLAERCRFSDCHHDNEPGCAVQLAVAQGEIEPRRLQNYLKLRREEALNTASLREKRAKDKALGKYYKRALHDSQKLKGR